MSQFARFVAAGVFNTALGYAIIFGCMYLLGIGPVLSNVIGYAIGLIASYTLNRRFTFNSRARVPGEFARFLVFFALAYALNFVALLACLHVLHLHEAVSQIVAGAVYVIAGYLLNKYCVFRPATLR
jgi:putative flippase GtrA